jgi:hypothetical protein
VRWQADLQARRPAQQRGWQRVPRPVLKRQALRQGPGRALVLRRALVLPVRRREGLQLR